MKEKDGKQYTYCKKCRWWNTGSRKHKTENHTRRFIGNNGNNNENGSSGVNRNSDSGGTGRSSGQSNLGVIGRPDGGLHLIGGLLMSVP